MEQAIAPYMDDLVCAAKKGATQYELPVLGGIVVELPTDLAAIRDMDGKARDMDGKARDMDGKARVPTGR